MEGRPESPITGKSPLSASLLPGWKENRRGKKVLPVIWNWKFSQVKIQCYIGIVGNIGIFVNDKGSDPVPSQFRFPVVVWSTKGQHKINSLDFEPLLIVKGDDRGDSAPTNWFYGFNSRLVLGPVIPKT